MLSDVDTGTPAARARTRAKHGDSANEARQLPDAERSRVMTTAAKYSTAWFVMPVRTALRSARHREPGRRSTSSRAGSVCRRGGGGEVGNGGEDGGRRVGRKGLGGCLIGRQRGRSSAASGWKGPRYGRPVAVSGGRACWESHERERGPCVGQVRKEG
ncbi:hypothetical protein OH76DRAFT_470125 [Lentinus brumalis]|uniref:Uncharacterized protein n=1 Tax=Lentinus brumalis TaxID=2498619 RepID=A0A371DCT0_9APHY|nr:hypothetical protein OH76DRAFT_470125 [Polyporus brumalis]